MNNLQTQSKQNINAVYWLVIAATAHFLLYVLSLQ